MEIDSERGLAGVGDSGEKMAVVGNKSVENLRFCALYTTRMGREPACLLYGQSVVKFVFICGNVRCGGVLGVRDAFRLFMSHSVSILYR